MGEMYTEVMVAKKVTAKEKLIKFALIAVTVLMVLAGFLLHPLILFAAFGCGLACYVFVPKLNVEFEYLYVSGELDVDRIYSKIRRKRAASYELSEMEILAPYTSHRLDSYKNNRSIRQVDYSSGITGEGHRPFAFVISSQGKRELVIFEPNEEMLRDIRSKTPRKVFLD